MLLKVNMNIKVVTKKFTFLLGILLTFGLGVSAKDIPNIQDTNFPALEYPIRENAFVMILQPVLDGSSDYTMTLCNKQSMCRQTSMQENEIRYIGLFLEDIKPVLSVELNKNLTKDEWTEKQQDFRQMYADYMNMYDNLYDSLETVTPAGLKIEVFK